MERQAENSQRVSEKEGRTESVRCQYVPLEDRTMREELVTGRRREVRRSRLMI